MRESDRRIVLTKPGNSGGGKAPDFWYAFEEGKDRGLAMSLETPEKIRNLQRKLTSLRSSSAPCGSASLSAKAEPEYRFYLLYDKVYREDILEHAYKLAKANHGAPGVDGVTFAQIEEAGVEEWLSGLRQDLCEKRYKPQPVRRVVIPKPGGGERPLGIPTIRDRVVQTAVKLVIEPVLEADLSAGDDALLLVGDDDHPQLLGTSPVHRGGLGHERALADRAQEVGVVVDPDDVPATVLAEPHLPGDAGQAFDDGAVHAAVHDAPRLQQLVFDLQLRPATVGGELEVLEAELVVESFAEFGGHFRRHVIVFTRPGPLRGRGPGVIVGHGQEC